MKKSLFVFLMFALLWTAGKVCLADEPQFVEKLGGKVPMVELKPEDDVFNADTNINELEMQMSEIERQQENRSDLDYIDDELKQPDLPCDSPKLKKQVESFIMNSLNQTSAYSVAERRHRILMVRNLADFEDVSSEKIDGKKYYEAASAAAFLRINQKREIKHICVSKNTNEAEKFKTLYILIYPYLNYYKVVVANLVVSTDRLDDASFIYNW